VSSESILIEPTIIVREYKAPKQLVYDAWTQVEHLKHWNFPFSGFVCQYVRTDIKAGGSTLHKMTTPNGFEMWLLTTFEELNPPSSIVFRQYNSNEKGEILDNMQIPNWPKEMRTTINLEETDGTTKLTLIWQPINPTKEQAQAFESSRANHTKGWGGGLEQLGIYLVKELSHEEG
jgi:uncharacterized protein YndB with AHSA1/START domain